MEPQQNRQFRRAQKAIARSYARKGWSPLIEVDASVLVDAPKYGLPGLRAAWKNNLYSVQMYEQEGDWGVVEHLMVRRHDGSPVRSWADMQRIKNEICGPERVAVEVYPAESKLVNDANMYHLWVLPEGFDLPFGLRVRRAEMEPEDRNLLDVLRECRAQAEAEGESVDVRAMLEELG